MTALPHEPEPQGRLCIGGCGRPVAPGRREYCDSPACARRVQQRRYRAEATKREQERVELAEAEAQASVARERFLEVYGPPSPVRTIEVSRFVRVRVSTYTAAREIDGAAKVRLADPVDDAALHRVRYPAGDSYVEGYARDKFTKECLDSERQRFLHMYRYGRHTATKRGRLSDTLRSRLA